MRGMLVGATAKHKLVAGWHKGAAERVYSARAARAARVTDLALPPRRRTKRDNVEMPIDVRRSVAFDTTIANTDVASKFGISESSVRQSRQVVALALLNGQRAIMRHVAGASGLRLDYCFELVVSPFLVCPPCNSE